MKADFVSTDPSKPFRELNNVQIIIREIEKISVEISERFRFMEVCGTHTMSAARNGLHSLLPKTVQLISGPGCPVCVTQPGYIVAACELAQRGITVVTFGDLMRVPGGESSLERENASGADVRVVYSPLDSLKYAKEEHDKEFVFLGIGFETTVPTVAATIESAKAQGVTNFSVLSAHKTMPMAMRALLDSPSLRIDGFLCPGHVSVITGTFIYEFIPKEYGIPCAVTGFEPLDILLGIRALLKMRVENRYEVENVYARAVRAEGNEYARRIVESVFEPSDAEWRGIGNIPGSGLTIREEYSEFDAARRHGVTIPNIEPPRGCLCGEVLRGAKEPFDCPLFDKVCNPQSPIGACMVSSEGACSAAWKYRRA